MVRGRQGRDHSGCPLHRRGPHARHCFSFLNRTLENNLAPLVIMARIRGTMFHSPYGLPVDDFDHLLIVSSKPEKTWSKRYNYEHRCQEEDVSIVADVTSVLTSTATQKTLRYSLNLISCAQIPAWKRKAKQVGAEDPRRAYTYFVEKRIVQELKKQQRSLDNSPSRSHLGQ
ncbi:TIP49 C-terminus-domain-containing protein [Armillaria nabsnona]|nr:TIP49 C-terminus-domain-containing protein [Armillaria nabsnona]